MATVQVAAVDKSIGKDQLQPRKISPWAISRDYARRYTRRDGESWVPINYPFIFEPVKVEFRSLGAGSRPDEFTAAETNF